MIKNFLFILLLSCVLGLTNPYRRCAHNPLYTSNAAANYMFAMPTTFIEATDTLIYYNIKHYGFKINNPGLGSCSNFFISNTSCCNITTINTLMNHTDVVYQSYANITKLPIVSLAIDLNQLLAGKNSSCLNQNSTLNSFRIPQIDQTTSIDSNIRTAFQKHDYDIAQLKVAQKALIQGQSCLFCLATQDWDKFVHQNASIIYDTNYYNSLINTYTNILTSLSDSSATITNYYTNFLTKNVNATKCSSLYNNYTNRAANSIVCNSSQTCKSFAQNYFGQFLIPGVMWKLRRIYLNRSDAIANYQPPMFGDGFKGNVAYL